MPTPLVRPSRRFAAGVLALVSTAMMLAGCGGSTIRASGERTLVADWRDGAALDVRSRNGGLAVERTGQDASVLIEAEITCGGRTMDEADDRLAEATITAEWADAGRLLVEPSFPGGRRNGDAASMTITIPAGAAMSEVRLRSSNGSLRLAGTEGRATLETSNGRVTVEAHDGPVEGSTSNGRLVLRDVRHPVNLTSSNGSIDAEIADANAVPVVLRTSNGSVRVVVPGDATGSLSVATSNGGIDVSGMTNLAEMKMSRRTATFVFTEDGPASSVRTSNGNVTVERRPAAD